MANQSHRDDDLRSPPPGRELWPPREGTCGSSAQGPAGCRPVLCALLPLAPTLAPAYHAGLPPLRRSKSTLLASQPPSPLEGTQSGAMTRDPGPGEATSATACCPAHREGKDGDVVPRVCSTPWTCTLGSCHGRLLVSPGFSSGGRGQRRAWLRADEGGRWPAPGPALWRRPLQTHGVVTGSGHCSSCISLPRRPLPPAPQHGSFRPNRGSPRGLLGTPPALDSPQFCSHVSRAHAC